MAKKANEMAMIMDEEFAYTLKEICTSCQVHAEYIIEMVDYGILEPKGKTPEQWRFPNNALELSQRALRLQHDFDLNFAGVALTLELLEQMNSLHNKISQLEQYVNLFHEEK